MTYYKLFLSQTYKDSVIKHEEKMTSLEYLNETKSPIWLKSFYLETFDYFLKSMEFWNCI